MGIKKRVVGSNLIVMIMTVFILELFVISFVHHYYYRNVEGILTNQAELSASFFHRYLTADDLDNHSDRLLDSFAQNSAAQVQIIDSSGRLLQDSAGVPSGMILIEYPDVQEALSGNTGKWRGRLPSTHEAVLAVAYPLQVNEAAVGAVRFMTSLSETDQAVKQISTIFIFAGIAVVVIVTVLSVLLSSTITRSVTELKLAAEQMAEGNWEARARKRYKDELGTLADTLNMMAAKLAHNEQLKNDFITSVSHELRTPLTSIKGWAFTLKANQGKDKALLDEGLEIVEMESDRLSQMVEELLDLSRLNSGRISLLIAPLHLPKLLRYIGKQLAPRAARQGVALEVRADDSLPVIQADENRLKQVLINVIDNSLKFTDSQGSITIQARRAEDRVTITVKDTGAGIAQHELAHVMRKFYKGNHQVAGSGLGLSISEQIIGLHGGRLLIDSRAGEGTKVEIVLPIRSDPI
ncbi:ATP-binding protein [Paenibacillus sp. J2TS4]|uniref:ATP-binding protein n=1 Tax=Paenibacillus sp. J2TS4 TaxID=2807194 RepID=UPI001AFDE899|nr:ATP-binding protein [Paenibacillus sp. J2TS4]GIP32798.1 sensor histidine kinase [Paenibacillus sp. J2TS4]